MRTTASVASIPELDGAETVVSVYPLPRTDAPDFALEQLERPAVAPVPDTASPDARSTPADPSAVAGQNRSEGDWKRHVVVAGDNLSLILQRMGVTSTTVHAVMSAQGDATALRKLRPGQTLAARLGDDGLEALRYEVDALTTLQVVRADGGFAADRVQRPSERVETAAHGVIQSSLFIAAQGAGLSDRLIMQLAEIFGWDVDFTLDLRPGDHFSVVFEEIHAGGDKVADGNILAAEFNTRGRRLRAVRFEGAPGKADYYSPEGKSLRKAFNRNPLPVTRITSRFNPNRLHPIFKTRRPHRGVDYGAPRGTPVRATGDGTVVHAGRKGGYGNAVVLEHGKTYRTLYAHLDRYASGVRTGSRVRQGQLIGYVGATGWATGPHLHYEFQVNGVHKDPLTVALPTALPIAVEDRLAFEQASAPLLAALDAVSRTHDVAAVR